ncbi:hypothetical protein DFH09DRAFT_1311425 [Mycena vulgaris]|nr:hypothetical protein DFH09DRAFT_1311425 [Mycena vulgaris]
MSCVLDLHGHASPTFLSLPPARIHGDAVDTPITRPGTLLRLGDLVVELFNEFKHKHKQHRFISGADISLDVDTALSQEIQEHLKAHFCATSWGSTPPTFRHYMDSLGDDSDRVVHTALLDSVDLFRTGFAGWAGDLAIMLSTLLTPICVVPADFLSIPTIEAIMVEVAQYTADSGLSIHHGLVYNPYLASLPHPDAPQSGGAARAVVGSHAAAPSAFALLSLLPPPLRTPEPVQHQEGLGYIPPSRLSLLSTPYVLCPPRSVTFGICAAPAAPAAVARTREPAPHQEIIGYISPSRLSPPSTSYALCPPHSGTFGIRAAPTAPAAVARTREPAPHQEIIGYISPSRLSPPSTSYALCPPRSGTFGIRAAPAAVARTREPAPHQEIIGHTPPSRLSSPLTPYAPCSPRSGTFDIRLPLFFCAAASLPSRSHSPHFPYPWFSHHGPLLTAPRLFYRTLRYHTLRPPHYIPVTEIAPE